ncbi:MAG: ATP-binding protein [Cyanobacteria bacterium P01_D01_bin.36]
MNKVTHLHPLGTTAESTANPEPHSKTNSPEPTVSVTKSLTVETSIETSLAEADENIQGLRKKIQSTERENRILQKQLARSQRARSEMEVSSQRREQMLRQSLKEAEDYGNSLAEAKGELTRLNQQLEDRIEIESAALSEATDHLQQANVRVANSEKFSTLGELVAGVAHEINNPISCITSNVKFVQEYTEQLLEHISLQNKTLINPQNNISPKHVEEIEEHAEDIDLAYIEEDLPNLIASMRTSGKRITAISQSLRTFARADTAQQQTYDLHEGIDGTLLILRHRLKALGQRKAITIHKNYGQLPPINCYPGQINQVFMNILANAIDAMEEGEKPSGPPEISIQTALTDSRAVITITDNAGGMPEHVQAHIFESQFTTKSAGKGTGLGLSIAHQIVAETHQGSITCSSSLGKGTTFQITLPV